MAKLRRFQTFVSDSARWDGFEFRDGDIVISSPPKSGTTLAQMLCALLIFNGPDFPGPLDEISPWMDIRTWPIEDIRSRLAAQHHRRFIKTHTPLDGLPLEDNVIYLVFGRDPRDVAISWEHHFDNMDMSVMASHIAAAEKLDEGDVPPPVPPQIPDPVERFRRFIDDDPTSHPGVLSLARVLRHLDTGWQRRHAPNIALFHFSDLMTDLPGQLGRIGELLGIKLSDSRIEQLAVEASLDRMRARAGDLTPDVTKNHWRDVRKFFRSGGSGEWRDRMSERDRRRYAQRVGELVSPEMADWAHNGWLGAGRPWSVSPTQSQ